MYKQSLTDTPADRKCGSCGKINRHRITCPAAANLKPPSIILAVKVAYYREMFIGPFTDTDEANRYSRLFYPNHEYRTYEGAMP